MFSWPFFFNFFKNIWVRTIKVAFKIKVKKYLLFYTFWPSDVDIYYIFQGDNVKDPEIPAILIHVKIMVSVSWMISEDLYVNVRMVILEDYARKCWLEKMEKEFEKG